MTFTPAELRQLLASDSAEEKRGRPITNPVSILFMREFGACPHSVYKKFKSCGIELSEAQRLQLRAWRKLHRATAEEREMLTKSVMQRLKRELAKVS